MLSHRGIIKRIYWFPLKAIDFNGVDTTSFLKKLLILINLFLFVDFLKSYCQKRAKPIAVEKLIENRKAATEFFF